VETKEKDLLGEGRAQSALAEAKRLQRLGFTLVQMNRFEKEKYCAKEGQECKGCKGLLQYGASPASLEKSGYTGDVKIGKYTCPKRYSAEKLWCNTGYVSPLDPAKNLQNGATRSCWCSENGWNKPLNLWVCRLCSPRILKGLQEVSDEVSDVNDGETRTGYLKMGFMSDFSKFTDSLLQVKYTEVNEEDEGNMEEAPIEVKSVVAGDDDGMSAITFKTNSYDFERPAETGVQNAHGQQEWVLQNRYHKTRQKLEHQNSMITDGPAAKNPSKPVYPELGSRGPCPFYKQYEDFDQGLLEDLKATAKPSTNFASKDAKLSVKAAMASEANLYAELQKTHTNILCSKDSARCKFRNFKGPSHRAALMKGARLDTFSESTLTDSAEFRKMWRASFSNWVFEGKVKCKPPQASSTNAWHSDFWRKLFKHSGLSIHQDTQPEPMSPLQAETLLGQMATRGRYVDRFYDTELMVELQRLWQEEIRIQLFLPIKATKKCKGGESLDVKLVMKGCINADGSTAGCMKNARPLHIDESCTKASSPPLADEMYALEVSFNHRGTNDGGYYDFPTDLYGSQGLDVQTRAWDQGRWAAQPDLLTWGGPSEGVSEAGNRQTCKPGQDCKPWLDGYVYNYPDTTNGAGKEYLSSSSFKGIGNGVADWWGTNYQPFLTFRLWRRTDNRLPAIYSKADSCPLPQGVAPVKAVPAIKHLDNEEPTNVKNGDLVYIEFAYDRGNVPGKAANSPLAPPMSWWRRGDRRMKYKC
jgi:hypothetical protein